MRALVLALGAALWLAPAAPAGAKTVTSVFSVAYEAKVTYTHDQAQADWVGKDALTYAVRGRLPDVTIDGGMLMLNQSAAVSTGVQGTATSEVDHPSGTSVSCGGTVVNVRGIAAIGRNADGVWFAPTLSATGVGSCTDSDGGSFPLELTVAWPEAAKSDGTLGLTGAKAFKLTPRSIDTKRWSKPFRISYQDEKCPNYDPARSIACTFVIEGRLTLTRVSREEDVDIDDLLGPVEPPKLNPKKTKATTTVECRRGCDIEALIGVFGGTKDKPRVIPLRRKTIHVKAKRAKTISLPVNAKGRAAAARGALVMSLKPKGGKARLYPLL